MKSKFLSVALSTTMITSNCLAQQQGATTAEEPARYAMILSLKSGPADHDVMVVRNQGNLYSFKYCRAFDTAPVPEVAQIRKDYFLHPNNYSGGDETQKIAAGLFESPACRTVGKEVYGVPQKFQGEHTRKVDNSSLLYFASLVPAALSTFASIVLINNYMVSRSGQNSTAFWRFLLSNQFPRGPAAIAIVTAIASGTVVYFGYSAQNEDTATNAKNEQKDLMKNNVAISIQSGVVTVDSMAEFGSNFQKGLDYAVAQGWFVEI
jgi:hypothetical protein